MQLALRSFWLGANVSRDLPSRAPETCFLLCFLAIPRGLGPGLVRCGRGEGVRVAGYKTWSLGARRVVLI